MMTQRPEPAIRIRADPTNPGQFFACCGLLELADRLWGSAEGRFASDQPAFLISPISGKGCGAIQLIAQLVRTGLVGELSSGLRREREELEDKRRALKKENKELTKQEEARRKELGQMQREGYVIAGTPFNLRLDWWRDDSEDTVKTWAGSQEVVRIARAALASLPDAFASETPFDYSCIMKAVEDDIEPDEQMEESSRRSKRAGGGSDEEAKKKVEPFYFDARRGSNALAIDIGFMPDSLAMATVAYPAVEFLCLVGLQRFRPVPTDKKRVFDYCTWTLPLAAHIAPLAVCGWLPAVGGLGFRFEVAFRTDQRKHKAFTPAIATERREI